MKLTKKGKRKKKSTGYKKKNKKTKLRWLSWRRRKSG